LSGFNLSSDYKNEYYFDNSLSNRVFKNQVEAVSFLKCPGTVEFIPSIIFDYYPKVIGLVVQESNMPVIKRDLFSIRFQPLKYLDLSSNEIKIIETMAFRELVNLKFVKLARNEINILSFNIFLYNSKLEHVDFNGNKIKAINPQLFQDLPMLEKLNLLGNQCINAIIACNDEIPCRIGSVQLNDSLNTCHQNCSGDVACSELAKVPAKMLKTIADSSITFMDLRKKFDVSNLKKFWKQFF
jgi:Leucine-rich repeat (LRR) protein